MPVKTYHNLEGRILGETSAGVRADYLTDAMGSVVGTADASQNIVNTYRYKPYGELLAKTGTGADPRFLWTGDTGSRTTGLARAEQYNRARHYGKGQAQWTSVDPVWPRQPQYVYVGGNPTVLIDPFGLASCSAEKSCCCCPQYVMFTAEKCYGWGGKKPECWYEREAKGLTPPQKLAWRGHNLTVRIAVTWVEVPKGQGGGGCTINWVETTLILPGGAPEDSSFEGSLQDDQWKACGFGSPPDPCNKSQVCTIKDQPGTTPYFGKYPSAIDYSRDIKIKVSPGANCPCGAATGQWKQHMDWTKTAPKDPNPWSP